jgi:hypothetical protein
LVNNLQLNSKNATPWNIVNVAKGKGFESHGLASDPEDANTQVLSVLRVDYPKDSYSQSLVRGISYYANPASIFNSRSARLSYKVYFKDNFDPVLGGKLPGLYIGPMGANGGDNTPDRASCRLMWREWKDGSPNAFKAEAYVYAARDQVPEYIKLKHDKLSDRGDSLWRDHFTFQKFQWNTVELTITVNDPNKSNGKLMLSINDDVPQGFDQLNWTATATLTTISGIHFDTFFGGDEVKYGSKADTSTYFKDFVVTKLA